MLFGLSTTKCRTRCVEGPLAAVIFYLHNQPPKITQQPQLSLNNYSVPNFLLSHTFSGSDLFFRSEVLCCRSLVGLQLALKDKITICMLSAPSDMSRAFESRLMVGKSHLKTKSRYGSLFSHEHYVPSIRCWQFVTSARSGSKLPSSIFASAVWCYYPRSMPLSG